MCKSDSPSGEFSTYVSLSLALYIVTSMFAWYMHVVNAAHAHCRAENPHHPSAHPPRAQSTRDRRRQARLPARWAEHTMEPATKQHKKGGACKMGILYQVG